MSRILLLNGELFNTLPEAQVLIKEWRQHDNRVRSAHMTALCLPVFSPLA